MLSEPAFEKRLRTLNLCYRNYRIIELTVFDPRQGMVVPEICGHLRNQWLSSAA